ncbi:MAG: AtpZ/AtpI family protein [Desulfovibrio sp.]|jgi:ATP synthase protein I|nr:AtpZ/AtpI family protein [Desulfovibrio sp.]
MRLAEIFSITDKRFLDDLSRAGTIGLHMVSGIAAGTAIGYALDYWLESFPWCTGVFMLLGIVSGFRNVYVDTKKLVANQQKETVERK